MSSTMNMDNDMSSNISNLNNIPNLAKSIEQGLDNNSGQHATTTTTTTTTTRSK